jgi:predicted ATPase
LSDLLLGRYDEDVTMQISSDVQSRYQSVVKKMDRVEARLDLMERQLVSYKDEIEVSKKEALVLEHVEELFKFLLDKYVHQYAESFSKIVTEGLQSIFHDQDLSFEVKVQQKHGKVWVEFETVHDGIRGQALEAFGGGIASVQSLLLRLLVLLKKGLARYLILDESLAALSEEYVENTGRFIQKMCQELDVNVLLITHNKSFLDHSDLAYEAKLDSEGSLLLERKGK